MTQPAPRPGWPLLQWLAAALSVSQARTQARRLATLRIRHGRPLVIAHRGFSARAPENTLPAFRLAVRTGADLVELDYQATQEGELVAFHDDHLDRTTNAGQHWKRPGVAVASCTWSQLQTLDAGSWYHRRFARTRIARLGEAIQAISTRSMAVIERKTGSVAATLEVLAQTQMRHRVVVLAFDWTFLRELHEQAPDVVFGALGYGQLQPERIQEARELGAQLLVWDHENWSADRLAETHAAGLLAWTYTVNTAERAQLLAEWGMDGIISDDPALMLGCLRKYRHRQPELSGGRGPGPASAKTADHA